MSTYLWTSIQVFANEIWIDRSSLLQVHEDNDDPLDGSMCCKSYKFSLKRIEKVISAARNSGFEIGRTSLTRWREHPEDCYCIDCKDKKETP